MTISLTDPFTGTLEESCAKTDWQVHAYCLMRNHSRLVIETPRANLVAGMHWLSGVYTKRFNIRRGHGDFQQVWPEALKPHQAVEVCRGRRAILLPL